MLVLAHIGGVPIEELLPQAVTIAGILAPLTVFAAGIARVHARLRRLP